MRSEVTQKKFTDQRNGGWPSQSDQQMWGCPYEQCQNLAGRASNKLLNRHYSHRSLSSLGQEKQLGCRMYSGPPILRRLPKLHREDEKLVTFLLSLLLKT